MFGMKNRVIGELPVRTIPVMLPQLARPPPTEGRSECRPDEPSRP
jgi:hypothetical protein